MRDEIMAVLPLERELRGEVMRDEVMAGAAGSAPRPPRTPLPSQFRPGAAYGGAVSPWEKGKLR